MADLIKKIKIKKQDGTYTAYLPIGADAVNIITDDGESVQKKLNKKPYYYTNVASMKADTKLKVGDTVQTLGYYEVNDGGGATYHIVTGNYTNNGYDYHRLDNGLFACLIIQNEINIKQFGAQLNTDISTILTRALALGYPIYIPKGFWYCENVLIPSETVIHGDLSISSSGNKGTILQTINGDPIFIFGTDNEPSVSNSISNLGFSGGMLSGECLVKLHYTYFNDFSNLTFNSFKGSALILNDVWEITFHNINIRHFIDYTKQAIIFNAATQNNSALYFDSINFEICLGGLIYFKKEATVAEIVFDNIFYEEGTSFNFGPDVTAEYQTTIGTHTDIPLIKMEKVSELQIRTINCINLGQYKYTINNQVYEHASIFSIVDTNALVGGCVNNVTVGEARDVKGYKIVSMSSNALNAKIKTFTINNMIGTSASTTGYYTSLDYVTVDIDAIMPFNLVDYNTDTSIIKYRTFQSKITSKKTLFNKLSVTQGTGSTILWNIPSYNGRTYIWTIYVPSGTTARLRTKGKISGTETAEFHCNIVGDDQWHTVTYTNDYDDNTTFSVNEYGDGAVVYNAVRIM